MDLNEILIESAKDGNMLVLKATLEKDADVNAKDENGWTALIYAKRNGHTEIVNFLIANGAIEYEVPEDEVEVESLFPVFINNKWGYKNKKGEVVISPQFDGALMFSEGRALVKVGGKWGYIDREGRIVISPQFDDAGSFSEGRAPVEVGGKWGYIDRSGNLIL